MNILVPTRNNPAALASMLGSLLAVTHHCRAGEKHNLYLMDGSNEPVLGHPHISRLLTMFNLTYRHFLNPQVNLQRIEGMSLISPKDIVLLTDDDHVFVKNPMEAVEEFQYEKKAQAYFGVAVDIINDKGFNDFNMYAETAGPHTFPKDGSNGHRVASPAVANHAANPGLLVCRASAVESLADYHRAYADSPAVADDAWAMCLADPPVLHTSLAAYHIGNVNRWWNNWSIKHTAVSLAVKARNARQ